MDPVAMTIQNGLEAGLSDDDIVQNLTSQYRLTRQQALEAIGSERGGDDVINPTGPSASEIASGS